MTDVKIDAWLEDSPDAPAAIVVREYLTPVEGKDGIFFPPTFAAAENARDFPGGYNINELGNGENVCLVDSVGSQANRIEPMFAKGEYAALVPQLVAGSVLVVRVCSLQGTGQLLADSVFARDLPTVLGLTVVAGAAVVAATLVADALAALADPRLVDGEEP